MFLKQSTSQTVRLGPFVDATDGDTEETALTINAADVRLSKDGGAFAAKNSGGLTHDENGWYSGTLNATDTNTVGLLRVYVHVAGALYVKADFWVLEEAIYDALFASSAAGFDANGRVDVGAFLGNAVQIANSRPEAVAERLGTQAKADVNAEVDGALDTDIPATPTAGSINERVKTLDDSYTAARAGNLDNLDAAVSGRSSHSAADVWTVGTRELTGFGFSVTVSTNNDKSGYALSAAGVDAILDEVYEGTTTFRQFLRLAASALFGKAAGLATTTATFRDEADTKDRITATVDADGNRSAVTLDKT